MKTNPPSVKAGYGPEVRFLFHNTQSKYTSVAASRIPLACAISILRLRTICTLKRIVQECVTNTRHHMCAVRVSHLLIVQNRFLANLLLNELFYLFTRITAVASFKRTLKTFLFRQEYGVIN